MSEPARMIEAPESGKIPSKEYTDAAQSGGFLIQFSLPSEQVAQVICDHLVRSGQMTREAFSNTSGSQIAAEGGTVFVRLHGFQPYQADAMRAVPEDDEQPTENI